MRNFDFRLKRQQKKSEDGQRAAYIRWGRFHEDDSKIIYYDPRPTDMYRIQVDNLMTGETHTLLFHPGDRMNNFSIDVDGRPWKVVGWTKAFDKIQMSCNKMAFPHLGDSYR